MKNIQHSREYQECMKSIEWQQVRELTLQRDNRVCQICGSPKCLEVHHIRYTHLQNEMNYPEDVITVCRGCHEKIHRYRDVTRALKEHYDSKRKEAQRANPQTEIQHLKKRI